MHGSVCVREALGGGERGGRPCTHRAGLRDRCPCQWSPVLPVIAGPVAGPVIAGQRSPVPTLKCSGRDRASPTRRWQPRAWPPGRRRPGRCTARSFVDAWLPNLIRFRPPPAQRPQPAPAPPRQLVRRRVRQRARGWRWRTAPGDGAGAWPAGHFMLHHGRPKMFVLIAHGFGFLMVFRSTIG
jgi:hypothetical protein